MSTADLMEPRTEDNGQEQDIATAQEQPPIEMIRSSTGAFEIMLDPVKGKMMFKLADMYASSTLVPDHFRNNTANCMIAIQLAMRLDVNEFMLMQHIFIVHGKPGFESKFIIALCNMKKVFKGPIRFEMSGEGKDQECTAWAIDRETGDRVEETVSMAIARAEGWIDKKGSKWRTMPQLMLKYRSAAWLVRTTCPEVLMGMPTTDELSDIGPPARIASSSTPIVADARPKSDRLAEQMSASQAWTPEDEEPVAESDLEPMIIDEGNNVPVTSTEPAREVTHLPPDEPATPAPLDPDPFGPSSERPTTSPPEPEPTPAPPNMADHVELANYYSGKIGRARSADGVVRVMAEAKTAYSDKRLGFTEHSVLMGIANDRRAELADG